MISFLTALFDKLLDSFHYRFTCDKCHQKIHYTCYTNEVFDVDVATNLYMKDKKVKRVYCNDFCTPINYSSYSDIVGVQYTNNHHYCTNCYNKIND